MNPGYNNYTDNNHKDAGVIDSASMWKLDKQRMKLGQ